MSDPVCVSIILSDLVICEQATRKNSLIGCFNNFNSAHFPFVTPQFFITSAITNLAPNIKEIKVCTRIEDPSSANVLLSTGATIQFGEQSNITRDLVFELPFPIAPFVIPKAGTLKVVVLVNTEVAGSRLFAVNALTSSSTQIQ